MKWSASIILLFLCWFPRAYAMADSQEILAEKYVTVSYTEGTIPIGSGQESEQAKIHTSNTYQYRNLRMQGFGFIPEKLIASIISILLIEKSIPLPSPVYSLDICIEVCRINI